MTHLPVEAFLPQIQDALKSHSCVIIKAEPGSGKTSRIPINLQSEKRIAVVEPRRLAAKLPALYVAQQSGKACGDEVGYQLRFESKVQSQTRIIYLTSGLLLRQMVSDPSLSNYEIIIIDEFHERKLDYDLLLAWIRYLQGSSRRDLKLLLMSATIDTSKLEESIADAKVFEIPGKTYPVEVLYRPLVKPDQAEQIVPVIEEAMQLTDKDGHILVFLPGFDAIKRAQELLSTRIALSDNWLICPLTAEISVEAQRLAIEPNKKRKIILATNVAETSLTIDKVQIVIDCGLAKIASYAPWSGLPILTVERIAQDACIQRTGRAGRQGPGLCFRLYSPADFSQRPKFTKPEIERQDLSQTLLLSLDLCARSNTRLEHLDWLEQPPQKNWEQALSSLKALAAINEEGELSEFGRKLAELPLHPRLAALITYGQEAGCLEPAILAACFLSEGMVLKPQARALEDHHSDISFQMELFLAWERRQTLPFEQLNAWYDKKAHKRIKRLYMQLQQQLGAQSWQTVSIPIPKELSHCVLKAYADRVAKYRPLGKNQKNPDQRHFHFAMGRGGVLADYSTVRKHQYLVVLDAVENPKLQNAGSRTLIRNAVGIDEDSLDLVPQMQSSEISDSEIDEAGNVLRYRRTYYGQILVKEEKFTETLSDTSSILIKTLRENWPNPFADSDALEVYHRKLDLLTQVGLEHQLPRFEGELFDLLVEEIVAGQESIQSIARQSLKHYIEAQLSYDELSFLQKMLPDQIRLANGRTIKVHYDEKRPWVAAKIQDFFGHKETPRLAAGRIPILLKLLAPNQRPAQITDDLSSFWQGSYHLVRKELARRYPKHAWPELPEKQAPIERNGGQNKKKVK